jgi:SAM-dependent methyltransferase
MNLFRYYEIVESHHQIQNPLSPEKLRRVIEYMRLRDGETLIDVGCGRGWFLRAIAEAHRINAVGLEINPPFADAARLTLAASDLAGAGTIVEGPALDFEVVPGSFDVATCIGATFALGGLEPCLDWLAGAVRSGGRIAVGEPFANHPFSAEAKQRWPEYDRTLTDIGPAFVARDLVLTGIVASAQDDWDHYESQHWRAAEAWLRDNPNDPDATWLAEHIHGDRRNYLAEERADFGWAVFVARKR